MTPPAATPKAPLLPRRCSARFPRAPRGLGFFLADFIKILGRRCWERGGSEGQAPARFGAQNVPLTVFGRNLGSWRDEQRGPAPVLLTVGLHQLDLHVVRDQGVGQLREETLHGPGHSVHGEILLCQVQVVICKARGCRVTPQEWRGTRSTEGV